MVKERKYIDISNVPELRRLAEEVLGTQRPQVLVMEGEELAIVSPAKPAKKSRPRGKILTEDDSLFKLIGIGASGGPGDVSENKHKYLAEAYEDHLKRA
jgi:hypothetical protein